MYFFLTFRNITYGIKKIRRQEFGLILQILNLFVVGGYDIILKIVKYI